MNIFFLVLFSPMLYRNALPLLPFYIFLLNIPNRLSCLYLGVSD